MGLGRRGVHRGARPRRRSSHAVLTLLLLFAPSAARARPGDLDATFGTGGKVITAFDGHNAQPSALALQPDGKIIAAGRYSGRTADFLLLRYNPNGTLDRSFGTDGKVITQVGEDADWAQALVPQPDGRIVAVGVARDGPANYFAVVRYNANGTLDLSFGDGGKVTTALGSSSWANAVVLQPDGKILVAGESSSGGRPEFAIARYGSDGTLDPAFGDGGLVTTAVNGIDDRAEALVLQPDGKLVASGFTKVGQSGDFALVRYNPNGTLDPSFGNEGRVITSFGASSHEQASALVLQPDGKLVAAGYSDSPDGFALARYQPDGTLDDSFGTGGKLKTPLAEASSLVLQPDGKLVAAGSAPSNSGDADFAVIRFDADGSLDPGFGIGGKAITSVSPYNDGAAAVVLQPDGKLVVLGYSSTGDGILANFALVRYVGGASVVRTPTPTLTVSPNTCVGNCDGGPNVTVDELVRGVSLAMGATSLEACPAFDANDDGAVGVDELVKAVINALFGCGASPPTLPPTPNQTQTPTEAPSLTPSSTVTQTPTITRTPTRTATLVYGGGKEDLRPCSRCDLWRFPARAGETYIVRADTTNPATAADLSLIVECGCDSDYLCEQSKEGDEEFPCFYPPPKYRCPEVAIQAHQDGYCLVSVSVPPLLREGRICGDPVVADYSLSLRVFQSAQTLPLRLIADDSASSIWDGTCLPYEDRLEVVRLRP